MRQGSENSFVSMQKNKAVNLCEIEKVYLDTLSSEKTKGIWLTFHEEYANIDLEFVDNAV